MGNVNMEATQIHFRGTGGGTVAQKLQALADAIENMPTFTSNDRDFLDDWESILPISDEVPEGQYVLSATKSELGATYSWEEPESGIINYSTTEQNTGQKWIDGRDIYSKTINFGAFPNATSKSVAHGIDNLNLLIKIDSIAYDGISYMTVPLVYARDDAALNTRLLVNDTNIVVSSNSDRSNITQCYVTLYYTKSTT